MDKIEKELLDKALLGDIDAFEKIYMAASSFVYNVALRIINNQHDAEEITQDVFLKIYKNLKYFKFESSFKTWIYRITVNSALNHLNKIIKEKEKTENYSSVFKNVSEKIENDQKKSENEKIIAALLNKLNPDYRTCLTLREIEGLSYKEIADVLKININTVRTRLKRARFALLTGEKQ